MKRFGLYVEQQDQAQVHDLLGGPELAGVRGQPAHERHHRGDRSPQHSPPQVRQGASDAERGDGQPPGGDPRHRQGGLHVLQEEEEELLVEEARHARHHRGVQHSRGHQ